MLDLILKDIQDIYSRENFKRILSWIKGVALVKTDWKFFEVTFTAGATNYRLKHGLGYRPKDVILTSVTNSEAVIFNYDEFSSTYMDLTVSGACTVRFFAGHYSEGVI